MRGIIAAMKLFLEILLSILLHPIAMILMWINLVARRYDDVQEIRLVRRQYRLGG